MANSYQHTPKTEFALGLVQGSAEWLEFKLGKVGASRIADITAKLRSGGHGASYHSYMGELIAERLTGVSQDTYTNAAMLWGREHEAEARNAYRLERLCLVEQIGIVTHPTIENALA